MMVEVVLRAVVVLLALMLAGLPAGALEFGSGRLPIAFEPARPVTLEDQDAIVVEGTVEAATSVDIVLRVDDSRSDGYANRVNDQRKLAPGPFKLVLPVKGLRTPGGRVLDHRSVTRVIVFLLESTGRVSVTRFATMTAPSSPQPTPVAEFDSVAPTLPVGFEPAAPIMFDDEDEIVVEGRVQGAQGGVLVLRIDDAQSRDYASRVNAERRLPSGPFRFSLRPSDLQTPQGRAIDHRKVIRMILFATEGGDAIKLDRFQVLRRNGAAAQSDSPAPAAPRGPVVRPRQIGKGNLPIHFTPPGGERFEDNDELRITGVVEAASTVGILVRIDDGRSRDYASRVNIERSLAAGPFKIVLGLKGQKASGGRTIDHRDVRQIIIASYAGAGTVKVDSAVIDRAAALPAGVTAYSLGALDAPVPAGLERIGPRDARVRGGSVRAIRRPAPDPVVAVGLQGIEQLRLAQPPGRARVTLYTEDPGEWENLPAPLQRRIRINGQDALNVRLEPGDWIRQRYLRGGMAEHTSQDDAWTAYGRWRGDLVALDVDVGTDGIVIDLAGADRSALYLSAVIVEPAGSTAGSDHVQALRRDWYTTSFPTAREIEVVTDTTHAISLPANASGGAMATPVRATAVPGTGARLRLSVGVAAAIARPAVTIEPPAFKDAAQREHRIGTRMWAGQRRLERSTLMRLDDARLVADLASLPLAPGQPRSYEIWLSVPDTAAPGIYRGSVGFGLPAGVVRVPIEVEVLAVKLPAVAKPAGFYLADAASVTKFAGLREQRGRQLACDLGVMRSFAISGTAPASSPVVADSQAAFLADMVAAQRGGVHPGWLVYQNLMQDQPSPDHVGERIAAATRAMGAAGLPPPTWSVADEPSNVEFDSSQFPVLVAALRRRVPGIKLGGHFNTPADEKFVDLVDTVIINYGFGLDQANIARLAGRGKTVWLYNTDRPRMTAGLWLWRSKAERYVQWHGRLPTADPFDPLDGREGDFQMIYPSAEVCPAQPDIHRDLLRLAEGIVDQRWLAWLATRREPEAVRLARDLQALGGVTWQQAAQVTDADLAGMRDRLVALARRVD